ncbi:MAG: O-antigen ligase family protein [Patescibacteria group bacterium]
MLLFILICGLLFLWLAYKNFELATCLLVAALPSFIIRSEIFGLPFTLLEVLILVLFIVFLLKNRLRWLGGFRANPFFWPLIAIVIFATISVFTSPALRQAAGIWKAYFIEPLLIFIILINTVKDKRQLKNIFWSLGLSVLYLSAFSFWQKFSGWGVPQAFLNPDGSVDRVVSLLAYPNALGLYLGPIIVLFVGFFWQGAEVSASSLKIFLSQFLKALIIAAGFLTIVLAKSEGAVLAVILSLLIFGLINRKTRLLTGGVILAFFIVFFFNQAFNHYLISKLSLEDYSGFIRRLIWQESWQMLKDNWLWGAGLAGYQLKIAPYHLKTFEIYLYPHNIILNFWSELGLLGLISFIWLFIKYFAVNFKNWLDKHGDKILNLTLLLVGLEIIVHGLVDAPYFKNDLSVLFWLIMAVAVINRKLSEVKS